jgi:hypothetical protein
MRLPRFRIRTLMVAVTVVAFACGWFKLFAFTAAVAAGAAISLGAIFTTTGRRIFEWAFPLVVLGYLLACSLP